MKALSLKQPWAELVVSGKKKIELRSWNTKFRGEFLIHAPGNIDQEAVEKFGFKDLIRGAIIGKAKLVDVKKYKNKEDLVEDKDKHLADSGWGSYGFVLENPEKIKPVKCKGALGFWEYKK